MKEFTEKKTQKLIHQGQINIHDTVIEHYTNSLRSKLRKNVQVMATAPLELTRLGVFKGMTKYRIITLAFGMVN